MAQSTVKTPLASFDIAPERRLYIKALIKAGYDTREKLEAALKAKGHNRITIYNTMTKFLSGDSYKIRLYHDYKPTTTASLFKLVGISIPDRIQTIISGESPKETPLVLFNIAPERQHIRDALIEARYDTMEKLESALNAEGHNKITVYCSVTKFLSGKSYGLRLFLNGKPTVFADIQRLAGIKIPKQIFKQTTPLASFDIAPERRHVRDALIAAGYKTLERLDVALKAKGHHENAVYIGLRKFLSKRDYKFRLHLRGKPTVTADLQTLAGMVVPKPRVIKKVVAPLRAGKHTLALLNGSQPQSQAQPLPAPPERSLPDQPRPLEALLKSRLNVTTSERFESALAQIGDQLRKQTAGLAVSKGDADRLIDLASNVARLGYNKGAFKPPANMDYNEAVWRFAREILRRAHMRETLMQLPAAGAPAARTAHPD